MLSPDAVNRGLNVLLSGDLLTSVTHFNIDAAAALESEMKDKSDQLTFSNHSAFLPPEQARRAAGERGLQLE